MYLMGLTGSIGMGKTLTAGLFEQEGVPLYDADAAVHALYAQGGAAVAPIAQLVPEAIIDGAVDRTILGRAVLDDAAQLKKLEAIVHRLVGAAQIDFLTAQKQANARQVLLDIPLLFETGGDAFVDCTIVVSAPFAVQQQRVLARAGMTAKKFASIVAKQLPDAEKRARADFVVDSSVSVAHAHAQVRAILKAVAGREGVAYAARLTRAKQYKSE
ncbi:MAG: dephospho-CoA kinase [Parvibaculales bacterium]